MQLAKKLWFYRRADVAVLVRNVCYSGMCSRNKQTDQKEQKKPNPNQKNPKAAAVSCLA